MHDDHGSRKTRLPGGFFVSIAKTHRPFLRKAKEGKQDFVHVDRLASARGQLLGAVARSRFLPKAKEGKQDTAHVDRLAQARGQLLIAVEGRRFCAQRKEAERDSFDA
jgi:hypothetical protein